MLPKLTRRGVLPPGIHRATLPEVVRRFGGGSAQRRLVTLRTQRILALAARGGWLRRAFLWGSYVTAKADPNDVDIMLVMSAGFGRQNCNAEMLRVFDSEMAERELAATVLWIPEDVPADLIDALLDRWQVGRDGAVRGIVEVIQ